MGWGGMKILIVKVSALGDIVHALPVLAWIRSAVPAARIDWLVEESFASLLEGHPLVHRVVRLRTKAWRNGNIIAALQGAFGQIRALRRERYDCVLDLQGNSKSGLFTLFTGAPLRFGFDRSGVREWPNLLATNRHIGLTDADHHVSDRSLAIARAAFAEGCDHPLAGPLPVNPDDRQRVENLIREKGLSDQPLVVLHYGTTWKTKLWPVDLWQQLAERLCREDHLRPVLTWGNPEELAVAERIHQATEGTAVIWPRGSLGELSALLKQADLVVAGDTGPLHIAAAHGTSTVSMFRVTDALRNGPRGTGHIRLQSPLNCSPCLEKTCDRDAECGHSIGLSPVLEAVRALLKGKRG